MATTTTILASRYNTLRNLTNKVLGASVSASPNYGYGQGFSTSAVVGSRADPTLSTVNKISAQDYEDLYIDLVRTRAHQIGSFAISPFVLGDYETNLASTDKVELAYMTALESLAAQIETDRFLIHPTQFNLDTLKNTQGAPLVSTRLNSANGTWNGVITHIFTVTFESDVKRREFFNAGGEIRLSALVSYVGSQAKTVDWQTILAAMGSISFKANNTASNVAGQGTGYPIGNYQLSSTYQRAYSRTGGTTYARNNYTIDVLSLNTSTIQFKVSFVDGQPNDITYGIDEAVFGDFTSRAELAQPDGVVTINGIEHPTVLFPIAKLPKGSTVSNLG